MSDGETRHDDATAALRERLRTARGRDRPPEIVEWQDAVAVAASWTADLDEQLAWCTDEAVAARRAAQIGRGAPEDYLQRTVHTATLAALCGIRHYGGDPDHAFIDIVATTTPFAEISLDERSELFRAALRSFDALAPRAVRVLRPGTEAPSLPATWSARADQVIAAERVSVIASRNHGGDGGANAPAAPSERTISLRDASVDEATSYVGDLYRRFADREPELATRVFPAERDDLARCRESGRLAWWLVDGERAGVIAVQRERWIGLDGWLVVEEVADPAFAGRGTASRAQVTLAAELPGPRDRTIFGTIDASNVASRRTARRAGRREIATWWFIRPASSVGA